MKTLATLLLLTVIGVPAALSQPRHHMNAPADQALVKIEEAWSQAVIDRDAAALNRFYADEYIFTNEDGVATDKAKEIANITSGAFRLTTYKFSDLKVQVYGNVALVTGENNITGTWEDINKDVSGPYRFTDVFVNRGGRWQAVASQSSRITLTPARASTASSASKAVPPDAEKKAMMAACMDKDKAAAKPKAAPADEHAGHHPDAK